MRYWEDIKMSKKNPSMYWQKSWGLVGGCTPVSAGCEHCWLKGMAHRFQKEILCDDGSVQTLTNDNGEWNGNVIMMPERLGIPLKTKKPTVFSIWSDLFHELVSAEFIIKASKQMERCKQHTFLVLTKRPERIGPILLGGSDYMPNVWLGTTVENQQQDIRIPLLISGAGQFKKFLSIEPLLEEINIPVPPVDQIICGAETGHHARPCNLDWIRSIIHQCKETNIPLFIKNIGKQYKKDMSDWPDDLKIRELAWRKNEIL